MPERIRPFEAADLEICYAISLATGFEGGDASHLYRDPKMVGHFYMAPYALLEPALALVVEDDEGVGGFAVGTADTIAWEERLERDWWPSLRRLYADPSGIPAEARTPDQRRSYIIHHPMRTPTTVKEAYPAHVHLNLLPPLQGRGVGSRLLAAWLARLGAGAVHVGINRANKGAAGFWTAKGFSPLPAASQRTLWMGRAFSASIQSN